MELSYYPALLRMKGTYAAFYAAELARMDVLEGVMDGAKSDCPVKKLYLQGLTGKTVGPVLAALCSLEKLTELYLGIIF